MMPRSMVFVCRPTTSSQIKMKKQNNGKPSRQNGGAGMILFVSVIFMNVAFLIMRKSNFNQLFSRAVCQNFNSTISKIKVLKGFCDKALTKINPVPACLQNKWLEDTEFDTFLNSLIMETEDSNSCDFQSINANDSTALLKALDYDQPLILHGLTANWTAFKYWGKKRLRSKYGKR